MIQSVLRASRKLTRKGNPLAVAQLRHTASKAAVGSGSLADDRAFHMVGFLAAAGIFAWGQERQRQKQANCCGIVGVVAHPKFDVR